MIDGNGAWFTHLKDYVPFILAVGQKQPKVAAVRLIEAAVTGIVIAALVGAGGYLIAIPQIQQSITNQAELTRIQLDFLSTQIAEAKQSFEKGQSSDVLERNKIEERLMRQIERTNKEK